MGSVHLSRTRGNQPVALKVIRRAASVVHRDLKPSNMLLGSNGPQAPAPPSYAPTQAPAQAPGPVPAVYAPTQGPGPVGTVTSKGNLAVVKIVSLEPTTDKSCTTPTYLTEVTLWKR